MVWSTRQQPDWSTCYQGIFKSSVWQKFSGRWFTAVVAGCPLANMDKCGYFMTKYCHISTERNQNFWTKVMKKARKEEVNKWLGMLSHLIWNHSVSFCGVAWNWGWIMEVNQKHIIYCRPQMKPKLVSEKLGCLQWQYSLAWLAVCKLSKGWHFAYTKVRKEVMPPIFFFLLNVALGTVSCPTHWTATLSISTRIIGAPVSHVHPTQ